MTEKIFEFSDVFADSGGEMGTMYNHRAIGRVQWADL